jgi:GMP synthase (glutamine-hydrolysing)
MMNPLRFLIVDGYPKESRDKFDDVGMRKAGTLYQDLLFKYVPDAETHIWYSSDPGAGPVTDEELAAFNGVLWPGCNLTVYHDDPRVRAHLDLCERAFQAGLPQFGSCWAIQVACAVAGGETRAHPKGREMGIADKILLTDAGRKHPMFEGKPAVYSHFVSHDDEVVKLPETATLLAGNDWSRIQAAEIRHRNGVFWGVQYHPEYDLHEMARLILAREEKLLKQNIFASSEAMKAYVEKLEALYHDPARKDLRWQLKISDDVLDDHIRECEFRNWVKFFFPDYQHT